MEWTFPRTIRTYQEQIDLLEALAKQDPALKIKASGRIQGLNNTLTNRKGMLEGLVRGGLLAQKEAREKRLAAWIAADPARQKEYGDVLQALASAPGREGEDPRARRSAGAALRRVRHAQRRARRAGALGREGQEARRRSRDGLPAARLDAHPRGAGAGAARARPAPRQRSPRLLDAARRGAAGRAADHRPRQARGPHAGHGEGGQRQGDRGLPRPADRGHEARRQGRPAWAARQDARPDRGDAGLLRRAGASARPARRRQPRGREELHGEGLAACGRATRRRSSPRRAGSWHPTPTRRCA